MPRPRKVAGRIVTYYYWRDPRDGQEKPLQCPDDRGLAIRRAKELNALVARIQADTIVQDIAAIPAQRRAGMPFNAWAVHYLRRIEKRNLAANTMRSRKSIINQAVAKFQDRPMHELAEDVAAFSTFFDELVNAGKARLAVATRSTLIDVFSEAHATGTLASSLPNPVSLTMVPKAEVKRARLTLDAYQTIWPHCEELGKRIGAWQPNSVLLAIVTGQRLEDVGIMQFKRGRDWEAAWLAFQRGEKHPIHPYPFVEDNLLWIVQQKTGALVRIPLALRLNAINLSVEEVIDRCRSSTVVSRYMVHHTIPFGHAPAGSAVHINTISRQFSEARKLSGLTWETSKTPPTFHELRSLSERLYRDQGIDTKKLLGHRHARMTEVYNDPRGAEWGTVTG